MDTLYDVVGYEGLYKINKNGDIRVNFYFAKSKYTLEQVIEYRNEKYIEYGLEKCD